MALSTGLVYGYYAFYLKVDEEEFGGHGPLIQEGLFASLTLFLVRLSLFLLRSQNLVASPDRLGEAGPFNGKLQVILGGCLSNQLLRGHLISASREKSC